MKKIEILFLCGLILAVQAIAFGQKTEVSVQKGKVVAQSQEGSATVDAGRKAVLTKEGKPFVTVDDPLVDDIIKIYKWIEAEKEANEIKIEYTSIQVGRIENEHFATGAFLMEMPNMQGQTSKVIRMGLLPLMENPKFYDLQGNLLSFTTEKVNERMGYYYIKFIDQVSPGEKFNFIGVCQLRFSEKEMWKEGVLWNLEMGNDTINCLNYFRVILPKSAIFVQANRPIIMMDNSDGRIALTIRNYTGSTGDGTFKITFLWPDKDGITFSDLPAQYRGVKETINKSLIEKYHQQMKNILAGEIYHDMNSPIGLLLTYNNAILRKDKELLIKSSYLCKTNPEFAKKVEQMDGNTWNEIKSYFIDELDLLNIPAWPDNPENGHIHPIYMCTKTSEKRADTLACIYENGKWYYIGNNGNPRLIDVNVFRKMFSKSEGKPVKEETASNSLLWNKTGPEDLKVYKEYVDKKMKYPDQWFILGINLMSWGYWEEAFFSFGFCETLSTHKNSGYYILSLIWQGHICDVWGKREHALQKYNAALDVLRQYENTTSDIKIEDYELMRHDQLGIVLNYKWVKERLEKPFTKEMIGK